MRYRRGDRALRGPVPDRPPAPPRTDPDPAPKGRDGELAEVRALLADGWTVGVLGPPGIGKTALAAALRPSVWVDLEDARTADDLEAAVAVAAQAADRSAAAIEAALQARGGLVVLDGAEEVLAPIGGSADGAVARIEAWSRVPGVSLLITTRRRCDALDAATLELGPLDGEAAAAVLVDRVRAVSAKLARSLRSEAVSALVAALDGVPLALELAAAHLRLYTAEELAERVSLDLLADPSRGARHGSLRAALSTSWEALGDEARTALARASVMVGPFDRERFAAVTGALGALVELLDAGLIQPVAGPQRRWRLLAPVRALAAERLSLDEGRLARGADARHLLAVCEPLREGLSGIDASRCAEQIAALQPALESVIREAPDPAHRAHAALVLAGLEGHQGPLERTVERIDGLDLAALPGPLRLRCALVAVHALSQIRRLDEAEARLARLEPTLQTDSDRARWLHELASTRTVAARDADALGLLEELDRYDLPPAERWEVRLKAGLCHLRLGHPEQARQIVEEVRDGTSPTEHPASHARACSFLASVLRREGAAPDVVHALLEPARDLHLRRGLLRMAAVCTADMAVIDADLGDLTAAAARLEEGAGLSLRCGDADMAALALLNLAVVRMLTGDADAAIAALDRLDAMAVSERTRRRAAVRRALVLAGAGRPIPDPEAAVEALRGIRTERAATAAVLAPLLALALAPTRPELAAELLSGDQGDGEGRLAWQVARGVIDGGRPDPALLDRARSDLRMENALLVRLADRGVPRPRVARDGAWFTVGAERVDMARKKVLARFLAALAAADGPLPVDALVAAAWPGERLVGDSGVRRVYVAVASLRKLGLRDAIVTVEGEPTGWRLDAEVVDADG